MKNHPVLGRTRTILRVTTPRVTTRAVTGKLREITAKTRRQVTAKLQHRRPNIRRIHRTTPRPDTILSLKPPRTISTVSEKLKVVHLVGGFSTQRISTL